jgi:hypothetical protein
MGRSFLSVKLAAAFGLCVAIAVLAVERVQAADTEPCERATTVVEIRPEPVVCLWRACPDHVSVARFDQRRRAAERS